MNQPRPLGIFISHSSKDRRAVETVAAQARAMGVSFYLAKHDVQPGQPLATKIEDQIRECDAVVVLLTSHGMSAPYVQQEIGFALALNKPVIPLVEHELRDQNLAMLEGVEYIPFDPQAPHDALTPLTAALNDLAEGARLREQLGRQRQQQAILLVGLIILLLILAVATSE